ncbi:MAG: ketopantoate reductase family protein [Candidatus Rokubacteria bacterium]|nr:ketopantoate reductase family protein [Candidatus Rokubacteria bacterium]
MTEHASPGLAFVGAGSLGQAFAALLAASGQAATLLATPTTAARLREAGRIRLRGVVTLDVPVAPAPAPSATVGVTADPSRLPAGVGVLFATKGHQLAGAIQAVRSVWPPAGDTAAWVGGLQNGVVKDDRLAGAFGAERVVGAVTILGAQREPDGQVTVTTLGATYLGELDGGPTTRVRAAAETLRKAGIPAEESAHIRSVLWSKACNAAGIFGVSVLTRTSIPRLLRDPDLIRAFLALVREAAAIAAAHGIPVGDYVNFPIRTFVSRPDEDTVAAITARASASGPTPGAEIIPSMTQDLLAGRALEVDEAIADLVERAERAGVAVPRLRLVRDMMRGIDPGRHPRGGPTDPR